MKHIFSKIAKIGEEVREAQLVEFAVGDRALEGKVFAEVDKAYDIADRGYDMVMKSKQSFQKSILQHKALIAKFQKEMNAFPANSPGATAYKKGIERAKASMKSVEQFVKLADRFPTF